MSSSFSAPRVVLRPIANPLPLGFLALAAGTLLISGLHLSRLAPAQSRDVGLVLLAFGFPLQLVAAISASSRATSPPGPAWGCSRAHGCRLRTSR